MLTCREEVLNCAGEGVLRCEPVIHSYIRGVLDEHAKVSDTFLLTKDTSMYLAGKALDAISLDRKTFR
jgi:hypothetical protein